MCDGLMFARRVVPFIIINIGIVSIVSAAMGPQPLLCELWIRSMAGVSCVASVWLLWHFGRLPRKKLLAKQVVQLAIANALAFGFKGAFPWSWENCDVREGLFKCFLGVAALTELGIAVGACAVASSKTRSKDETSSSSWTRAVSVGSSRAAHSRQPSRIVDDTASGGGSFPYSTHARVAPSSRHTRASNRSRACIPS